MELIRRDEYRAKRWKNGAGVSFDIAAASETPPGWRISLAAIERDAPFSEYAGYDRTLVVVAGPGVLLHFDGGANASVTTLRPFAFPGERRVLSTLIGGRVDALNVMTTRAAYTHRVELARLDGEVWRGMRPFRSFAYLLSGPNSGDTVRFSPGEAFPPGVEGAPCVAVAIFKA
jgi:environmental stress-induced protein Ves